MSDTTTHRPGCDQPGWEVERSSTMRGVSIARCMRCRAVELRTAATTPQPAGSEPTRLERSKGHHR